MKKLNPRKLEAVRIMHDAFISVVEKQIGTPSIGCEVGVCRAELSLRLFEKFDDLTLYMVDPYLGLRQAGWKQKDMNGAMVIAQNNTVKFANRRVLFVCTSLQASCVVQDESLDFVFIDADHGYEYVKEDINAWYPKVRNGGLVSGHDYQRKHLGTIRAVDEFAEIHGYKITVDETNWWFVKGNKNI